VLGLVVGKRMQERTAKQLRACAFGFGSKKREAKRPFSGGCRAGSAADAHYKGPAKFEALQRKLLPGLLHA
jgi:hypothetical protein